MGATLLFAAFTVFQASQQIKAGKAEAKAIVKQGELAGVEKAKQIRHKVARQTSSFLNAGLALEGTPEAVISETFATGKADVAQIAENTNIRSKNAIRSARSRAIGTIVKGFIGASAGSLFSTAIPKAASFLPEQSLFALNQAGFGSTAFEALEFKDLRG